MTQADSFSTGQGVGAAPAEAPARVGADGLTEFARDLLTACGLPATDAAEAAAHMVEADLIGARTHGVIRLTQYVEWLRGGHINANANIAVMQRSGATALVDGDNGIGHLVVAHAARTAVEIAREHGVAWVGTRASNHAGAGGIYAAMPVAHGMVGIYAAVSGANHMAIWGGAEPSLGTNPIAIGIPSEDPPLILDIATSVSSFGAIRKHALEERAIPAGWLANREDGSPITDPKRAADGFLLPIGGHKGSGLSLMIGLLAGVLNGAAFGKDVRHFKAAATKASNTGQFVIALDVARFMPLETFRAEVDRHLEDLRGTSRLPGVEVIRLPGDERRRRREAQAAGGVELTPEVVAQLDKLADAAGIVPLSAR